MRNKTVRRTTRTNNVTKTASPSNKKDELAQLLHELDKIENSLRKTQDSNRIKQLRQRRKEIRSRQKELVNTNKNNNMYQNYVPMPKSYLHACQESINNSRKISGRDKISARFVQGGAPGSGQGGKR